MLVRISRVDKAKILESIEIAKRAVQRSRKEVLKSQILHEPTRAIIDEIRSTERVKPGTRAQRRVEL